MPHSSASRSGRPYRLWCARNPGSTRWRRAPPSGRWCRCWPHRRDHRAERGGQHGERDDVVVQGDIRMRSPSDSQVRIFTHMLPEDMRHYIAEVAQVLKRGGTCCASYNLLDAESLRTMKTGRGAFRFTRLARTGWSTSTSRSWLSPTKKTTPASCSRSTGCRARSTTAGGRAVRTHRASRLGSSARTTLTSGTSIRTRCSRPR
jgi:hypothetical protein